ncbi:hypothetical protein EX30DRAFT_207554 [Ascodesmis nigricans]|uniref:Uncharacterized protein n=1 Tax=Ascodesmis nigricans TaxID=341454 RepID=A0A4S2MK55_9PEZI|nr:hypothetical protein EX30DRAFT_207554 [Ascodesmis nigricans]
MQNQSQVVFTVAILISSLLFLLILRALFLRRARQLALSQPDPQHVNVVVIGGGWRDGGIGGVGRGQGWRVPTDVPNDGVRTPPPAAMRGGEGTGEEDLPRYEAPPPEYESVVKEERRERERGVGGSSGEVVIEMGAMGTGSQPGASAGVSSVSPPPPAVTEPPMTMGERLFGRFNR